MALCAAFLAAAPAGASADTQALPDLVQMAPSDIMVQFENGSWLLGFTSGVGNIGNAPFEVLGKRDSYDPDNPSQPDMTAYQILDGQNVGAIGALHYEDDLPNHDHWHFQPFDQYTLHRVSDDAQVGVDQKEGFCLIDGAPVPPTFTTLGDPAPSPVWVYTPNFCDKGNKYSLSWDEGLSVGWMDEYSPIRGGQDVDITDVPSGRYYLVHHVNWAGNIRELDPQNDYATATIDLWWPADGGAPVVKTLRTCLAASTCPYTDPPAPPAPPPPPPPPPAQRDTTPPTFLLGGATRQRFLRNRTIYVYAKCNEPCTVRARGRIAALQIARSLRTASARMKLRPGRRTKIKLPISKRTRRIINRQLKRRHARVIVRVSLVATDAAGNHTSKVRTLRLLPRNA